MIFLFLYSTSPESFLLVEYRDGDLNACAINV